MVTVMMLVMWVVVKVAVKADEDVVGTEMPSLNTTQH